MLETMLLGILRAISLPRWTTGWKLLVRFRVGIRAAVSLRMCISVRRGLMGSRVGRGRGRKWWRRRGIVKLRRLYFTLSFITNWSVRPAELRLLLLREEAKTKDFVRFERILSWPRRSSKRWWNPSVLDDLCFMSLILTGNEWYHLFLGWLPF